MPQQPALTGQGRRAQRLIPPAAGTLAREDWPSPAGVPLQHTALRKNLGRGFLFFKPQDKPLQARCARRKGSTMQINLETGEILEDGSDEELAEWIQRYRATREHQTPCAPQDETCPF
jgi:hypothetical protein